MKFRFRHKTYGGHTHIWISAGRDGSLGLAGRIILRNEEWAELADIVDDGAAGRAAEVEFENLTQDTGLWSAPDWMIPYLDAVVRSDERFSVEEYMIAVETRWWPVDMDLDVAQSVHDQVSLLIHLRNHGQINPMTGA